MATAVENLFVSQHISTTFPGLIAYRKTNGSVRRDRSDGESGGDLWIATERIVQQRAHSIWYIILQFHTIFVRLSCLFACRSDVILWISAIELSNETVEGVEIEEVDIASLPMLNTDLEKQGTFPAEVEAFRRKILEADSILFASPEYNFSVTAPLKNAMDWGSRPPNVWGGKASGIVSAGGLLGGARGQFHLRQIGIFIDLHFLNKPEFFLNVFEPPPKFNLNGNLIDEDAKLRLKQMLLSLKAFTLQLHQNN